MGPSRHQSTQTPTCALEYSVALTVIYPPPLGEGAVVKRNDGFEGDWPRRLVGPHMHMVGALMSYIKYIDGAILRLPHQQLDDAELI